MKKITLLFLLAVILLVPVIVAYFFLFNIPVDVKTVKMYILVSNYTGFNVDTDCLYFGTVPGEGQAERTLNVTNDGDEKLLVNFYPGGNISKFISFSKNNFVIEPKSREQIKAIVYIPHGTQLGEYSGFLNIFFRRNF